MGEFHRSAGVFRRKKRAGTAQGFIRHHICAAFPPPPALRCAGRRPTLVWRTASRRRLLFPVRMDLLDPRLFDAAIVGAGPAGAHLAALLARRGCAVALVDKSRFPRDKVCG
ncbi:MAG: FAD-dependent monooxygenase, partial [Burkholderiaceae bacterium]